MKKCRFCGAVIEDNEKYCSQCGVKVIENEETEKEVIDGEVVEETKSDAYLIEEAKLDDFERRAKSNFNLSIISIVLCCCTITSIISFVLSIILLVDLNKVSEELKNDERYKKIKTKTISALVIASILVFMGIVNAIDSIVNAENYSEMYDSIMSEIMNSLSYE